MNYFAYFFRSKLYDSVYATHEELEYASESNANNKVTISISITMPRSFFAHRLGLISGISPAESWLEAAFIARVIMFHKIYAVLLLNRLDWCLYAEIRFKRCWKVLFTILANIELSLPWGRNGALSDRLKQMCQEMFWNVCAEFWDYLSCSIDSQIRKAMMIRWETWDGKLWYFCGICESLLVFEKVDESFFNIWMSLEISLEFPQGFWNKKVSFLKYWVLILNE